MPVSLINLNGLALLGAAVISVVKIAENVLPVCIY